MDAKRKRMGVSDVAERPTLFSFALQFKLISLSAKQWLFDLLQFSKQLSAEHLSL